MVECLHKTLSQAICGRMVRYLADVSDSISLQNGTEFVRTKLRSIVTHKNVGSAIATKKASKHLNSLIGCGTINDMHLRPLECASTATRYICPSNGPAKSTCILSQGL